MSTDGMRTMMSGDDTPSAPARAIDAEAIKRDGLDLETRAANYLEMTDPDAAFIRAPLLVRDLRDAALEGRAESAIAAGELARRLADLTLHERVERGLDAYHAKGPDAGLRQVVVEYRPVRLGDVPAVAALLAEVTRLDKQLRAARLVTLTDADGHPDDAALVRQLEDAAKEVDSSLLECAALRLKRALADRDRLRAAAEAALRLCGQCRGTREVAVMDWDDASGRYRDSGLSSPCPACGPIRRGLDAGEGCDA
jgi:hypothetical protein